MHESLLKEIKNKYFVNQISKMTQKWQFIAVLGEFDGKDSNNHQFTIETRSFSSIIPGFSLVQIKPSVKATE